MDHYSLQAVLMLLMVCSGDRVRYIGPLLSPGIMLEGQRYACKFNCSDWFSDILASSFPASLDYKSIFLGTLFPNKTF